jgi:hypothetical protein
MEGIANYRIQYASPPLSSFSLLEIICTEISIPVGLVFATNKK